MYRKMSRMNTLVRCVTSRQICFPLLFAIATISLMVTLMQFSYISTPNVNQRRNYGGGVILDRFQRTVQDYWKRRSYQGGETRPKTPKKLSSNLEIIAASENENVLPKINLPFANKVMMKKTPRKKSSVKRTPSERGETLKANIPSEGQQKIPHVASNDAYVTPMVNNITDEELTDVDIFLKLNGTNDDPFRNPGIANFSVTTKKMLKLLPRQTRGVLIVTNYRSGSTFLGELFNQHPQAFYTFEPLYPFGYNCSSKVWRRVETLRQILSCTFPSMTKLYKELGVDPKNDTVHNGCLRNNFCFRYNHKHLCTKDICPNGDSDRCMNCGPVDLPVLDNKCRSRQVSVIKVIKLCYIESLEPIFQDPSLDIKIIHLVRDPRGITSSRLKIHPDWDIARDIVTTCRRQITNAKAGKNLPWLKNNYKRIRYEDLAMHPLELAQEIYDFVGLKFVDSVKRWITQNTKLKGKTSSNIRARRVKQEEQQSYSVEKDPYATQRDSSAAMQAWRQHITFATTDKVQKQCPDTMRTLGYRVFSTERDLLNLNISTIS